MTHISEDQLATFKARLEEEGANLKSQLERIATKDPHVAGDYDAKFPSYTPDDERDSDKGEDALEVQDYVNNIGVENILELRLVAVQRALERVAGGTYGHCSNCDAHQPIARLEADPAAERCLNCKKLV